MKFIKLTSYEFNTTIYVNIETICAVYADSIEGTIVRLSGGNSCWVSEEPEEILKMIENTLNKNNNKN